MMWLPMAFYTIALSAVVVVALRGDRHGGRDPMHSRQMWFRILSEADTQTSRRWARAVTVCYLLTIAGGVAALAVSSTRPVQDGPLLASSRTH